MSEDGRKAKVELTLLQVSKSSTVVSKKVFKFPEHYESFAGRGIVGKKLMDWIFRHALVHPTQVIMYALTYDLTKYGVEDIEVNVVEKDGKILLNMVQKEKVTKDG